MTQSQLNLIKLMILGLFKASQKSDFREDQMRLYLQIIWMRLPRLTAAAHKKLLAICNLPTGNVST